MAADVSGEVARRARELGDQVQEQAAAATAYASDQLDRVSSAVTGGADRMREATSAAGAGLAADASTFKASAVSVGATIADRTSSLTDDALRKAGSAAATAQNLAYGATAAAREAAETGIDAARKIGSKVSDVSDKAAKTVFQTIEQNPLLVAGVGLIVGGLIASALPRSDFEDDLVGDASTAAKRRAQAAASQGFDAAKAAVGEIYGDTVRQAEAEGLTADGVGQAAKDLGQRVRRVAEAAVTTAFEPSEQDHKPDAEGENHHG